MACFYYLMRLDSIAGMLQVKQQVTIIMRQWYRALDLTEDDSLMFHVN